MSSVEAKINQEMLRLEEDHAPGVGAILSRSNSRELSTVDTKPHISDLDAELCFPLEGEEEKGKTEKDAFAFQLNDDLQVEILARVSCVKYWQLQFLNERFSQLLRSGDIFRVRQERGLVKPFVFMLTSDNTRWTMFDKDFQIFQKLPEVPSDFRFFGSDKETVCVGTQLIVVGKEVEDIVPSDFCFLKSDDEAICADAQLVVVGNVVERIVVWRYELEMNKWFKGPEMIAPRVMYGSASNGTDAFFAGGIQIDEYGIPEVVSIVEKYDSSNKRWTMVQGMHRRRKFSSGCFLQGKFYVIGGIDEDDKYLTCGESYDEVTNSWKLIPGMVGVGDITTNALQSPPLIAVVNNNLYLLEPHLNELRVYDVKTNVWETLGIVPVRANIAGGWGVAFKSVGDRLLLIGAMSSQCETMTVYSCRPTSKVEDLIWERSNDSYSNDNTRFNHFIQNCSVMFV